MPQFKKTDSTTDQVAGTLVKEVDAQGKPVNGFLSQHFAGTDIRTVAWNVRNAEPGVASPCPVWLNNVVVSDTLQGAKNGKHLAGQIVGGVDPSSSSSSQNVNVIAVDAQGNKVKEKVFNFSLVRRIQGEPPKGQMAIATELWLSMEPIDTSDPVIAKMASRCQQ